MGTCDYHKQGIACADAQNAIEGMKQLWEAAKDCKTRADYIAFMRKIMPIDVEEAADGIILHFHKKGCTCVHPDFIRQCGSELCECTKLKVMRNLGFIAFLCLKNAFSVVHCSIIIF